MHTSSAPSLNKTRMTKQRRMILDALRMRHDHPTADMLWDDVLQTLPHCSRGTVYRNLDILCAQGLARKLPLADGSFRFDGNLAPHAHLVCTACQRIDDYQLSADALLPTVPGWQLNHQHIYFSGLCPQCRVASGGSSN